MSLSKQYKTDEVKVVNGYRHILGENEDKSQIAVILSFMGETNQRYAAALDRATKPHKRKIQLGTFPDSEAKRITREIFITHVMLGWENVLMADVTGNPEDTGYAPFNKENANALFDRLPLLYTEVANEASNISNFLAADLEEEVKN